MILPTKRLNSERALLSVGGEILAILSEPKTVSRTWFEYKQGGSGHSSPKRVSFDWFVLALDLLYALGAIEIANGRLVKVGR